MQGEGGAALIEELWRQHLAREPQWILVLVAALPAALAFFTLLTLKARAHLRSIGDLVRFFFAPFAPELFVALLDAYGWHVAYDSIRVERGRGKYLLYLDAKVYTLLEDPLSYAEPASLLDMKGPRGIPSPFGLVPRLLIAWILALILAAAAWTQTAYITLFAFARSPTWIDVTTTIGFLGTLVWYLKVIGDISNSRGLMLVLVEIPPTGPTLPLTTRPEKLAEWARLLARTMGESDECQALEELASKLGVENPEDLATILAKAVDADLWRRRVAALEEEIEKHVEAAEAAALRSVAAVGGFGFRLEKILPWLAIVIAAAAILLVLQPSVHLAVNSTATASQGAAGGLTPAVPPPPPIPKPNVTITPAQPPAPPIPSG